MRAMMTAKLWHRVLATILVPFLMTPVFASSEKVLYTFAGGADGSEPYAGLVMDAAGNLYGTTYLGGNGFGTVFQLTPGSGGTWTESVIYSFTGAKDGSNPAAAVILDAAGNLYGTTAGGGASGQGTAFKLTRGSGGTWTESVLHSFAFGSVTGDKPLGALVFDAAGNLYGTTNSGSTNDYGAVFELSPAGGGKWTAAALHVFNSNGHDGTTPAAGLILDAAGNLYGTTSGGGSKGYGVVFMLTKGTNGKWTETLLHTFNPANGHDGANPLGSVTFDSAGNLYGTTSSGGTGIFYGIVYKLTLGTDSKWTETVLRAFNDDSGGGEPLANVILDAAGNVYGTAHTGGTAGVAFKLTLGTDGKWHETVLHNFKNGSDGSRPFCGLVWDATGHLYGTTQMGGTSGLGTVFQIAP
jgi:uncharacterized repeat protein (TIGR03803 family)